MTFRKFTLAIKIAIGNIYDFINLVVSYEYKKKNVYDWGIENLNEHARFESIADGSR